MFLVFSLFWKLFMAVVIVASLFTVPVEVNVYFLGYVSHNVYWIFTRLLLDTFCFIDIFIQAFTGHYNSEKRIVILHPLKNFSYKICISIIHLLNYHLAGIISGQVWFLASVRLSQLTLSFYIYPAIQN